MQSRFYRYTPTLHTKLIQCGFSGMLMKLNRVCGVPAPLFQKNPKLLIKRELKLHRGSTGDSMFRTDGSTGGLFPNWTVSFQTSVVIKKEEMKKLGISGLS